MAKLTKSLRFGTKKDDYKTILYKIHSHLKHGDNGLPLQLFDEGQRWIIIKVMEQQALLKAFRVFREQMRMVERQIYKNRLTYEYSYVINTNSCIRLLWKLNRKEFKSLKRRYERSDIDNPILDQLIKERQKIHKFMDKYLTLNKVP